MRHGKKMIAPAVWLVLAVLQIGAYVVVGILIPVPVVRVICVVVGLASIGAMVAVFIQRYREVKGGEEDDLSQY